MPNFGVKIPKTVAFGEKNGFFRSKFQPNGTTSLEVVPKKKSRISQWGAAQLWYHSLKFRSDQYFKNYFSAVFGQSEGRVMISRKIRLHHAAAA